MIWEWVKIYEITYWCLVGNEGMIPVITSNNNPSNPQQPIHSLLSTSKKTTVEISVLLGLEKMMDTHIESTRNCT